MAKYFSNSRLILAVVGAVVLAFVIFTACNVFGGDDAPSRQAQIVTPADDQDVLAGSSVQVQSIQPENVSRVDFFVSGPDGNATLQSSVSEIPETGVVNQMWNVPASEGVYTLDIQSFNAEGNSVAQLGKQIQVVRSGALSLEEGGDGSASGDGAAFQPDGATVTPSAPVEAQGGGEGDQPEQPQQNQGQAQQDSEAEIQVQAVATATPTPSPTPIPRYPPPPPAPGVPPGPTQAQLPEMAPPVCDAAEYIGVYSPISQDERITIGEDDDIAVKAVGGTLVHRAWRLRNIGTCTWGPGYELSFYGGRTMGSGGVIFGPSFPTEPVRRNALVDENRLIVPEGQPNQAAVAEVLLQVPTTPGIHQSYWRMRNPHGVYFGPIVGVTFNVVRECNYGIYGAPRVLYFEILGYGDVFRPEDPAQVQAEYNQMVTLDWHIINATNFDISMKDPTGDVSALSNTELQGRAQFRAVELGEYTITMYADNGPCTAPPVTVSVDVVPPEEMEFDLDVILAPSSAAINRSPNIEVSSSVEKGDIMIEWNHPDEEADQFELIAQLYRRTYGLQCPFVKSIFGSKWHCYKDWSSWHSVAGKLTIITVGRQGEAQGMARISNIEENLCPNQSAEYDPDVGPTEEYGIEYIMRAGKSGGAAVPEYSNKVDTVCVDSATNRSVDREIEIQGGFNPN